MSQIPTTLQPECKRCSVARIFVNEDRSVFIVHGDAYYYFKAGSPEAEEHVRAMQASALGGVLQMALAKRKKD